MKCDHCMCAKNGGNDLGLCCWCWSPIKEESK